MKLILFIIILGVKNYIAYYFYSRHKKITFVAGYFVVTITFFYLNSFWKNDNLSETIPIILNLDFFLIFFSFLINFHIIKVDKFLEGSTNLINPIKFFFNNKINIKTFYFVISTIQIFILFLIMIRK